MSVTRFGISIEQPLLEALDEYVKENFFTNRSQAIRQLISKNIVEKKWQCNNQVAGAITLLYDPKSGRSSTKLHQIWKNSIPKYYHPNVLCLSPTNGWK